MASSLTPECFFSENETNVKTSEHQLKLAVMQHTIFHGNLHAQLCQAGNYLYDLIECLATAANLGMKG